MNFNQLNLNEELIKAVAKGGYVTPTEIQEKSIPVILENKDLIGKSHTGTGKTAAFVLPILNRLDIEFKKPQAIILCPTRELALQVLEQIRKFSIFMSGVNATLICGGSSMQNQIYALKKTNIVVGTPGRIVDHLRRRTLRLDVINTVVLDEADEMLKMGFKTDIDSVFENITSKHQTLLFSATMPKAVTEIANKYLTDPVSVTITQDQQEQNNITQYYIDATGYRKDDILVKLLEELNPKLSIIFTNTRLYTERLSKILFENGIKSVFINGDKSQNERMRAMKAFKTGQVKLLIATDVAARGLDIDGIDYIFNYDIPNEKEVYTHRIGRTARAGMQGTAITIAGSKKELMAIKDLERYQKKIIDLYQINLEGLVKDQKTFKPNTGRKYGDYNQGSKKSFSGQSKSFSNNLTSKSSSSWQVPGTSNKIDRKRTGNYK